MASASQRSKGAIERIKGIRGGGMMFVHGTTQLSARTLAHFQCMWQAEFAKMRFRIRVCRVVRVCMFFLRVCVGVLCCFVGGILFTIPWRWTWVADVVALVLHNYYGALCTRQPNTGRSRMCGGYKTNKPTEWRWWWCCCDAAAGKRTKREPYTKHK